MKLDDASIVLSCHCFDDFPINHDGPDADSLLIAWTLLWHPAILRNTGKIPGWARIDDLHSSLANRLLMAPTVSWPDVTQELIERAAADGCVLARVDGTRDEMLARVLPTIDAGEIPVDSELLADFFALGYCYLQIELLTRRMRYSSGVSQTSFQDNLSTAANAALTGETEAARANLRACFDQLTQEREHYYAVEVFLLDIAMVAEGLSPARLNQQLAWSNPTNLMISGHALRKLAESDPPVVAAIREAIHTKQVAILGGEDHEYRLPLLPSEAVRADIVDGLRTYQEVLDYRPTVFARRRYGLTPSLPQILRNFNFKGAIHATLDDGQFPQANQTKSRWEGKDGSVVDAIMRTPLDASRSATFLNLAGNISDAMDMDHVATRCFVHWAGTASPWYAELRRVVSHTKALGRFVTAAEYFHDTYSTSAHDRFTLSQYRSPYLKQAVDQGQTDPISAVVRDWKATAAANHLRGLLFLVSMVNADDECPTLQAEVDSVSLNLRRDGLASPALDSRIHDLSLRLAKLLATKTVSAGGRSGTCLLNTASFPVRELAKARALPNPKADRDAVYAIGDSGEVVADVPGMGFVWLPDPDQKRPTSKRRSPGIAVDNLLRNEFLEAAIDPTTGSLRTLRDYESRGSRLSQQLAFRMGKSVAENDTESPSSAYSRMIADKVEIVRSDSMAGEIVTHGRLVGSNEDVVGEFSQTYRLERGSRVVRVHITLDPRSALQTDPWNSYYGLRFAWSNEASELLVGINDMRQPMTARRFESPLFVEIDDAAHRTSILCGGIPFHLRTGRTAMDTPLLVVGESARSFDIGLGVDLRNPFREAVAILGSSIEAVTIEAGQQPSSGWLFHVNARNVIATSWNRIEHDDGTLGFRVRLMETDGKSTPVTLSTFRPVESARKVDYAGETVDHCQTSDNQITFSMHDNEWTQIEARFASRSFEVCRTVVSTVPRDSPNN